MIPRFSEFVIERFWARWRKTFGSGGPRLTAPTDHILPPSDLDAPEVQKAISELTRQPPRQ